MNLFRKHSRKQFEQKLEEQLGDMEYKPSGSLWDRIDSGMSSDGFEQPVRSKLDQFEQMPYPETWDRIESHLPNQKQPIRRIVFFVAAFVTLMGAVATSYFITQPEETPQLAVSNLQESKLENQIEVVSPSAEPSLTQHPTLDSRLSDQPEPAPVSMLTAQSYSVLVNQPAPTHQRAKNNTPKPTVKAQPQVLALPTASNNSDVVAAHHSSDNPNTPDPLLAQVNQSTASEDQPKSPTPDHSILASSNVAPSDTTKQILVAEKPMASDSTLSHRGREIPNGSLVKSDTNNHDAQSSKQVNEDELTRFSMSVFAGLSMSGTTYTSPVNSSINFDENIKLRKEIERPEVDWSGSFMLDYRINDRWMVSAGLSMVNFNQKLQYDIDSAVNPSRPNDIGAPIVNPGDSFLVGNTYSNRIRYTWTEIPVMVNYTVYRGNRWDIDLQGGVGFAFISTIDGGIVSYDNKGVLVLKDKESFPQISNTVFATLQPQISKKFAQGVSVGIVPSFKYSVTSIIGNQDWIQQHPYFIGLSACIRKRF